jgi:IPT/TIG domain
MRVSSIFGDWEAVVLETEPINPLYTGQYAVGPYTDNTVEPSGSDTPQVFGIYGSYTSAYIVFTTTNPANSCNPGADGTEAAPASVAATGWWSGQLCTYGHSSWASLTVKGNRTLTLEVTAEDEQGLASTAKAMPVIGVWNQTDPRGSLPGIARTGQAFNGQATGMTMLTTSSTQPNQLRIAISDQRGDGRPDFNYKARVLYADSLTPSTIGSAGGTITITGIGFRTGNAVFVNGVAATVASWTANTIVATVPSLHTLGVGTALVANVTVEDLSTGGTTVMTRALNYTAPATTLSLLTAPAGNVILAQPATVPFAVQVLLGDGITPVVGEAVTFTATIGTVQFAACGAPTCVLHTDARGIASTLVTPEASGATTLQATGIDGTVTASFTAIAQVRSATAVQPVEYIAVGASVRWTPQLSVADNIASTNRCACGVADDLRPSGCVARSVSGHRCGSCPDPRDGWAACAGCAGVSIRLRLDKRVRNLYHAGCRSGGVASRRGQWRQSDGLSEWRAQPRHCAGHRPILSSCSGRRRPDLPDGGCVADLLPGLGPLSHPACTRLHAVLSHLRCERPADDNAPTTPRGG